MSLRGSVVFKDFKLDLPLSRKRAVLRISGNKLATRIRKRLKASGKHKQSGQLIRSFKFRLRHGVAAGVISPRGMRIDSDTHIRRAHLSNFAIAAFLAARGIELVGLTSEEERFVVQEINDQITKLMVRKNK